MHGIVAGPAKEALMMGDCVMMKKQVEVDRLTASLLHPYYYHYAMMQQQNHLVDDDDSLQ